VTPPRWLSGVWRRSEPGTLREPGTGKTSPMDLVARLEHVDAWNSVAFALALSAIDRSWGTETLAVAGGQLVLCGPGMYVNRAIAAGFDRPGREGALGLMRDRSAA